LTGASEAAPIEEARRLIGEPIRSYADLMRELRARVENLNISRVEVDRLSGMCGGYSSKVLAPRPLKNLGMTTLPLMLGALGVALRLEVDPEAMERITRSVEKRQVKVPVRALAWGQAGTQIVSKRWVKRIAAEGGRARARALSPAKRRALARRAARARWSRPKLVEMKNGLNRK
jgi:hypothetical protein